MFGSALAGRDAGYDFGAVFDHLPGVEAAFLAGDALHQNPCALIYQNTHLPTVPMTAREAEEAKETEEIRNPSQLLPTLPETLEQRPDLGVFCLKRFMLFARDVFFVIGEIEPNLHFLARSD